MFNRQAVNALKGLDSNESVLKGSGSNDSQAAPIRRFLRPRRQGAATGTANLPPPSPGKRKSSIVVYSFERDILQSIVDMHGILILLYFFYSPCSFPFLHYFRWMIYIFFLIVIQKVFFICSNWDWPHLRRRLPSRNGNCLRSSILLFLLQPGPIRANSRNHIWTHSSKRNHPCPIPRLLTRHHRILHLRTKSLLLVVAFSNGKLLIHLWRTWWWHRMRLIVAKIST